MEQPKMFYRKIALKIFAIFAGKHLILESPFNKETPTQVFCYEYCEMF